MIRLIYTLLLCLIAGAVSSEEKPRPEQQGGQSPAAASPQAQPPLPWLDAVRAQRKYRETQRRANRAAIGERRRRIDPWGAARQEAIEEETRLRREAFKDEVDRNREALRKRSGWTYPIDPRYPEPPSAEAPAAKAKGLEQPPPAPTYPPSGWDNPWYFMGH